MEKNDYIFKEMFDSLNKRSPDENQVRYDQLKSKNLISELEDLEMVEYIILEVMFNDETEVSNSTKGN